MNGLILTISLSLLLWCCKEVPKPSPVQINAAKVKREKDSISRNVRQEMLGHYSGYGYAPRCMGMPYFPDYEGRTDVEIYDISFTRPYCEGFVYKIYLFNIPFYDTITANENIIKIDTFNKWQGYFTGHSRDKNRKFDNPIQKNPIGQYPDSILYYCYDQKFNDVWAFLPPKPLQLQQIERLKMVLSDSLFWQSKFHKADLKGSIYGYWVIQGVKNNQYRAFGQAAIWEGNRLDSINQTLHKILSELPLRDTCYLNNMLIANKQMFCCESWGGTKK